jgi:hypothetical protein
MLAVAKQAPQATRVTVIVVVSRRGVLDRYGRPVAEDITIGEATTPQPEEQAKQAQCLADHVHLPIPRTCPPILPPLEEVRKYTSVEFLVRSMPSLWSPSGGGKLLVQLWKTSGLTGFGLTEGHIIDCPVIPMTLSYCQ